MRSTLRFLSVPLLTFGVLATATDMAAQDNPAHNHIGHVLDGFGQTPGGEGLLPTALAEAQIAIQHANLAAADLTNLASMQLHTTHVLHAVDPSRQEQGPGLGFGVRQAAEGVAQHIGLAASSDGASDNVAMHSDHVAASARTVAERAGEIAELADRIAAAESAAVAAPLVEELQTLAEQLVTGRDATGDGQISWQEGEGGLEHVEQHMGFLAAGEGLD